MCTTINQTDFSNWLSSNILFTYLSIFRSFDIRGNNPNIRYIVLSGILSLLLLLLMFRHENTIKSIFSREKNNFRTLQTLCFHLKTNHQNTVSTFIESTFREMLTKLYIIHVEVYVGVLR